MAYTKKTWNDGEVITKDALNNIENGIEAADTALAGKADTATAATKAELSGKLSRGEADTLYASKNELKLKPKKGTEISAADATAAVGGTPTKDEFDKVVALANACKQQLNAMNA